MNPQYDRKISTRKGVEGGVEGTIVTILSLVAIMIVKNNMNINPDTENVISAIIGTAVGAVSLALSRYVNNRKKHIK